MVNKVVGIAVDDWKLKIFKRDLGDAGFEYTVSDKFTEGTTLLKVETSDVTKLEKVVKKANNRAMKSKMH